MKKAALALLVLSLVVVVTWYVPISLKPLNAFLIGQIGDRLDAEIKCGTFRIFLWDRLELEDLEAFGRGGFALSADKGRVEYNLASIIGGRLHVRCGLKKVRFYQGGTIMNSLSDMLYIDPIGNITFDDAMVEFFVGKEDTITHNLELASEKIRITGNALTDIKDNLRCRLRFYLSEEIAQGIPEEIRGTLLSQEGEGWYMAQVNIVGNYKKPVLRIMTQFLRMNIS